MVDLVGVVAVIEGVAARWRRTRRTVGQQPRRTVISRRLRSFENGRCTAQRRDPAADLMQGCLAGHLGDVGQRIGGIDGKLPPN